ncbi:MAG: type I DNA topoisomerase [Bacillota bacterium]|nr:type I DNA topoisomerase [Bacillota bacterium]
MTANPKPLIIVESPAKAKTIEKFLGRRFLVKASLGHVRDLPRSQLGVDVEEGFKPKYITIRGKGEILKELRKAKSKASRVLLATDPDREGEAISWHLAASLEIDDRSKCRVEFHEITKDAVSKALKAARPIDERVVDSQQARRVLDRLVGYNLSPLLWKKVRPGLSAGRVQSAALKMVVDREAEIQGFVSREYWTITARVRPVKEDTVFEARFVGTNGDHAEVATGQEARDIASALEKKRFVASGVKVRERRRAPAPPFTTSTLQQEASRSLGFGVRRTMSVAQQLYEGVDLGPGGQAGLVTYIRTDSVRIAEEARQEALTFITGRYGSEYASAEQRQDEKRPGQQGAHEAIRPTSVPREPESVKQYLTPDQHRLYRLIWERFVASNIQAAVYNAMTVDIVAGESRLRATGSVLKFPGHLVIYKEGVDEESKEDAEGALPPVEEGDELLVMAIEPRQHFTQPPSRFTEAMLVKALEERGIGRPSTYAPIVETLAARRYVMKQDRRFMPTDLGNVVTQILSEYFPYVVDVEFTAQMEQQLDKIEAGEAEWRDVIAGFYANFSRLLKVAEERIGGFEIKDEPTEVKCDKCGRFMVKKHGRYGEFLACPGFPECRNTRPIVQELDVACPQCGGALVVRKTKKGRTFYGCSNYPACNFISWDRPLAQACPECGSLLVEKRARGRTHIACSNKECGYRDEPGEARVEGEE